MNRIQANEIVNSIDSLETIKAALQACMDREPARIEKTGDWFHFSLALDALDDLKNEIES